MPGTDAQRGPAGYSGDRDRRGTQPAGPPGTAPEPQGESAQEPWDRYARAIVEVALPAGGTLVVTPLAAPAGEATAEPAVAAGAPAHPLLAATLWFLTACDPYPKTLTAVENAARLAALDADLVAAGIRFLPALGRAPDHSEWEESRVLIGVDREVALQHAAAFEQLAVFAIDAQQVNCIATADGRTVTSRRHRVTLVT